MDELTQRVRAAQKSRLAGALAAGLAAAIGAVITSFAGIEGTLAGAIGGAIVLAVGTELLTAPFDAIERRLVRAGFSAVRLRRLGLLQGVLSTPGALIKLSRSIPRRAVLGVLTIAATGFLLGMTAISALELSRGQPISAATTNEPRTGTTVGNIGRAAPPTPADPSPTRLPQPALVDATKASSTPDAAPATPSVSREQVQPPATAPSATTSAPTTAPPATATAQVPRGAATQPPPTAAPPSPSAVRKP